jgi:hypothetical protein
MMCDVWLHSAVLYVYLDNETTSRGLSPPQIPAVGDYFDVHVTMAANPGNFTVIAHEFFFVFIALYEVLDVYKLYVKTLSLTRVHFCHLAFCWTSVL